MSPSTDDAANDRGDTLQLTDSERYDLLVDDRRRRTLEVLTTADCPIDLADLAEAVASRDSGLDTDALDGEVRRTAITLHHAHLPRLDDFGLVDYDPASHRVERERIPDDLVP